jgi:hypothetical protein
VVVVVATMYVHLLALEQKPGVSAYQAEVAAAPQILHTVELAHTDKEIVVVALVPQQAIVQEVAVLVASVVVEQAAKQAMVVLAKLKTFLEQEFIMAQVAAEAVTAAPLRE